VTEPSSDNRPFRADIRLLAISGTFGFLIGLLLWDWQWAVEHAQVLSGVVSYPPASPVGIAHAKFWSLVPQLVAPWLWAGVSEATLSRLLSGVLGCLSFQALASVCYAASRQAGIAIGAAAVVFASYSTDYGVVYPIRLLDSPHTYGVLGLSFVVLTLGLLALGRYRLGAFLLPLGLAVQLPLGLWTLGVVAIAVIGFRIDPGRAFRPVVVSFAAGLIVTLVSLAVHRVMAPEVPAIDAATASRFLHAFVPYWDGHRVPVDLTHRGVLLVVEAVLLALAAIWSMRLAPASVVLLLRIVVVGGLVSLGFAAWSQLPPAWMPDAILSLMPGRMLNVHIMLVGVLLIGLIAATGPGLPSRAALLVVATGLLLCRTSLLWKLLDRPPIVDFGASGVLRIGAVMYFALLLVRTKETRAARHLTLAFAGVAGLAALLAFADAVRGATARAGRMNDWRSDPLLAAASQGSGPLLTGGDLFLVQLRTRRALLIDGSTLDTLPYALEAGPITQQILTDVYQIDLFDPPAEAKWGGRVPRRLNRSIWSRFSREGWTSVGRAYGVTQVLTPAEWGLDLPVLARSSEFELYAIPR
jgi:hypothetical protein